LETSPPIPSSLAPIKYLGAQLEHEGITYQLWMQRGEWHLYRGKAPSVGSFNHFLIIKADRPESTGDYQLPNPQAGVNVCGPFYANLWVARDKLVKLAQGETRSMSYRPRSQNRETQTRTGNLLAIGRLSLDDVFNALDGR
jgi:hypothetical protein